ncbi:hypothetical protein AB8965_05490 [Yersinia enterocolitica]|uniref:hypothetical protein n=1 Tax=Yersinia enterocolitica TaxID=630 RepID=UPI003D02B617
MKNRILLFTVGYLFASSVYGACPIFENLKKDIHSISMAIESVNYRNSKTYQHESIESGVVVLNSKIGEPMPIKDGGFITVVSADFGRRGEGGSKGYINRKINAEYYSYKGLCLLNNFSVNYVNGY